MQDAGLSRTRLETWSQTHQYNHQQLHENGEGSITLWETDATEGLAGPRYQPGGRSSRYETCFHHETKGACGNQRYTQQKYEQPCKPLPPCLSVVHRDAEPGKVLISHSRAQPVEFGPGIQEWRRPCMFERYPRDNEADEIPIECNDSECRCPRRDSGVEVDPPIRIGASTSPARPSLRGGADRNPDDDDSECRRELDARIKKLVAALKRPSIKQRSARSDQTCAPESSKQGKSVHDGTISDGLKKLSSTTAIAKGKELAQQKMAQQGDGQQAESETQDTQAQQPGVEQAETHGESNSTSQPSLRGGGNHDSDDEEHDDEDPERDAKIEELAELLKLHNVGARRRRESTIPDQKCVAGSSKQGAKMTTTFGQDDPDLDGSCKRIKLAQQEESQEAETEHTQAQEPGPQQTEIQEAETQQVGPAQDADPEEDLEEDDSSCSSDADSFYGWSPVRSNEADEEVDHAESAEQQHYASPDSSD